MEINLKTYYKKLKRKRGEKMSRPPSTATKLVRDFVKNNLDNKEGWTAISLSKKLNVSPNATRYVLQILSDEGVLVDITVPNRGQRKSKTIYYIRKHYEKKQPKNWGLKDEVDVHNIFADVKRTSHCGGRG
tara:strand:+ start:695 stop:1087 length:393 start_codon:yes stop_codon:yes gene_type:complete